jgi:7-cyano-7-deazaguanine synthase
MRAVVLLSGGIDSTVTLAYACSLGRECLALSFDYGQRHRVELNSAQAIAAHYNVEWKLMILPPLGAPSCTLLSTSAAVPMDRSDAAVKSEGVPSTYVPARNTLFLAYALGQAEIHNADEIYFGANADDSASYPDCQPAFLNAFQQVAYLGTQHGVVNSRPQLCTPLLKLNKNTIVAWAYELKVPLELTFSCYAPQKDGLACLRCDACLLRSRALAHPSPHSLIQPM